MVGWRQVVGGGSGAPTEGTDQMLTVEEAAERYNFSSRRLRQRAALGAFPGAREVATEAGRDWLIPVSSFDALGYHPVQPVGDQPVPSPEATGAVGWEGSGPQTVQPEALEAVQTERQVLEAARADLESAHRQLEADRRRLEEDQEALHSLRQHHELVAERWLDYLRQAEADLARERRAVSAARRQVDVERRQLATLWAALAARSQAKSASTPTPPPGSATMEPNGS